MKDVESHMSLTDEILLNKQFDHLMFSFVMTVILSSPLVVIILGTSQSR